MGDEAEAPHRQTERRKTDHHEPACVESFRENDIDRHADKRRHPGRKNGHACLPGAVSAYVTKKQRRQIDGREDADARNEREDAPEGEVPVSQRSKVDDRPRNGETADDEQETGDSGDHRAIPNGRVVKPVPARPFFEHIFQGSQRHRQKDDAGIVGALEQREIRLVDLHEQGHEDRYRDAGNDVGVEKPSPLERVGDEAANHGPERRRDRGDGPDHGR